MGVETDRKEEFGMLVRAKAFLDAYNLFLDSSDEAYNELMFIVDSKCLDIVQMFCNMQRDVFIRNVMREHTSIMNMVSLKH